MNLFDIILLIPTAYLVYRGWKRGLVREVATLAGIVAGIWAASHLSIVVAEMLSLQSESSVLVAFFICFVGALVLAYLLGRCIEGMLKAVHLGLVNRIAGAVVGMVKALCILAVLLNTIVMFDSHEIILTKETRKASVLYQPVYNTGNKLTDTIKQFIATHKSEWEAKL